jgi:hypothetical protein
MAVKIEHLRKCKCGSGLWSQWYYDARGIELEKACEKCWPEEKKKWRQDVLEDPNYEAYEDIEEE